MGANEARIAGYSWALAQELHSDYNDTLSWRAFDVACLVGTPLADAIPGDEAVFGLWQAWERGAEDAKIFLHDDEMLGVADIVERTGMERSYIQAELKKGVLVGRKVGNGYVVFPDDFRKWLANPKRGSRTKKSGLP